MAAIITLRPLSRQQGIQIPGVVSSPDWVDALVLSAGTAKSYTIPTDSGGSKGNFLGIGATGTTPLWLQADGTAAVPATDVTDGTAASLLRTDAGGSYLIALPDNTTSVSFISTSGGVVSIEVWK